MDYDITITPGARCATCKNHGPILIIKLVWCNVYHEFNEDEQAEHCINYCAVKQTEAKDGEG